MNRWAVSPTNSATGRVWRLLYTRPGTTSGAHVATVEWAVRLDLPGVARDRVEAGLNGLYGDHQPPRCWTLSPTHTDTPHGPSWLLLHNGRECASITWHRLPSSPTARWQARFLAGLNVTLGRHDAPPPAPLPAHH